MGISSITFSHVLFSFSFLHFFRFYFVLPASDSSSVHRISNNTHCLSAAISSLYRALSLFPSLSLSLSLSLFSPLICSCTVSILTLKKLRPFVKPHSRRRRVFKVLPPTTNPNSKIPPSSIREATQKLKL